ncbi:cytochrome c nitrite reductase small subunit [Sorangium sp. So ce1389]|uniref:cytochrome c nitrite reductase small subunit n=1 Tax=Sorangium sp. So ce1389 TaxID=3133336 RepID=UPI003F5F0F6A
MSRQPDRETEGETRSASLEPAVRERPRDERRWTRGLPLALCVALGAAAGLGGYTFVYAKGASYLQNDPSACANCHIMNEQFDGWQRSSHRAVAGCNDCHAPHTFLGKYATKATNGFWHSFAFTSGRVPDPIRIKPGNLRITEEACRGCHDDIVHAIDGEHRGAPRLSCVRCHESVGHLH